MTTDRVVLRSSGGIWIFCGLGALLIFLLGDAVVRGAFTFALSAAPWLLFILWGAYMLLARPCVVATPKTLILVNITRTHLVPWARITDLTSRFQLTVHCDDGRSIRSWGAPSVGVERPSMGTAYSRMNAREENQRAAGVRRRTVRALPLLPVSRLIEQARDRWELQDFSATHSDDAARVTTRIAGIPLALGALIAVLCLLQLLLGG